jgi:ABC-type branched-subunit amino acid transport system permease subunit
VSIGHGVFVAAGAYTAAVLEKYLGLSLLRRDWLLPELRAQLLSASVCVI